jgi:hypothetical protein
MVLSEAGQHLPRFDCLDVVPTGRQVRGRDGGVVARSAASAAFLRVLIATRASPLHTAAIRLTRPGTSVILVVFLRQGAKRTRKPFVCAVEKDVDKDGLSTDERDFE